MIMKIKCGLAAIGGAIGVTFGGWDMGLKVLLGMVLLDYFTGMYASAYEGVLSSRKGIKGAMKKVMIFTVVYMAVLLDKVLGASLTVFNVNATIRMAVIFFYIANEGISILENIERTEVPLPKFIRKLLEQVKQSADQGEVQK